MILWIGLIFVVGWCFGAICGALGVLLTSDEDDYPIDREWGDYQRQMALTRMQHEAERQYHEGFYRHGGLKGKEHES